MNSEGNTPGLSPRGNVSEPSGGNFNKTVNAHQYHSVRPELETILRDANSTMPPADPRYIMDNLSQYTT